MTDRGLLAFDRGDVDDGTSSSHPSRGLRCHGDDAGHVHPQHLADVGLGKIPQSTNRLDGGVVDQHIDPAKFSPNVLADRCCIALDIAGDRERVAAEPGGHRENRPGTCFVARVMQHDLCPGLVQAMRDSCADVAAGAGHQRNLTREIEQLADRDTFCGSHAGNTTVGRVDADVAALIDVYRLRMLPVEATLYASTWVSSEVTTDGSPAGTAIVGLYLADPPSRSLFHRLTHDEVWHFYCGDPLRLVLLFDDGSDAEVVLGPDWAAGQLHQFVVPAGTWQAGEVVPGGRFSLFGCTMAPGFTGDSFTGGSNAALVAAFPTRRDDIERLSVPEAHAVRMPDGFTQ